ncbi:hypothetical protein N9937_02125 [bacterium]|nr:hypothetical protein [bacterium]
MSTLETDVVTAKTTNGDLSITGNGTGVPDLETGTKLNGVALGDAATATIGTEVLSPTGDGSGLSGLASPVDYAVMSLQETSGSAGGGSIATTWTKRSINTVELNDITGASLATGQITLPAGTYRFDSYSAAGGNAGRMTTRLYNVTDAVAVAQAIGSGADTAGQDSCVNPLSGVFTIAAEKVFEYQYFAQTAGGSGLGYGQSTGAAEVFVRITLAKVA